VYPIKGDIAEMAMRYQVCFLINIKFDVIYEVYTYVLVPIYWLSSSYRVFESSTFI